MRGNKSNLTSAALFSCWHGCSNVSSCLCVEDEGRTVWWKKYTECSAPGAGGQRSFHWWLYQGLWSFNRVINHLYQTAKMKTLSRMQYTPCYFKVVVGCQNLINANFDTLDAVVKGIVGELRYVSFAKGKTQIMLLQKPDPSIPNWARNYFFKSHRSFAFLVWTLIQRTIRDFAFRTNSFISTSKYHIERRQFQMEHAMGITCHRFQRKLATTLNKTWKAIGVFIITLRTLVWDAVELQNETAFFHYSQSTDIYVVPISSRKWQEEVKWSRAEDFCHIPKVTETNLLSITCKVGGSTLPK